MSFKFRNDYKYSESRENDLTRYAPQSSQGLKQEGLLEENSTLREELSEKNFELQETQTELSAVKQLVDNKDQALFKLKEELKQVNISNKKAIGEQRFLQEEILTLQREQSKLLGEYELVLSKFEAVSAERNEKVKYIEYIENKLTTIEQQFSEMRSRNIQLEMQVQEIKLREQESQHEIKLFTNQISTLQEEEDEYILDNKELRRFNEEYSEKLLILDQEIQEAQKEIRYRDCKINDLQRELKEYEELLGDLKGGEEEVRRNNEEKDRGIQKIKELIIGIDAKEKLIDEKNDMIRETEIGLKRVKEDNYTIAKNYTELQVENEKLKERIKELHEKIELLEAREEDVKVYLVRKSERLRLREDAENQLLQALKSIY